MTGTYKQRLELARQAIHAGIPSPPVAVIDQARAAAWDAYALFDRIQRANRQASPADWHRHVTVQPTPHVREVLARTLAAIWDFRACPHLDPHLAGGGLQPVVARMPLHRLDCAACARTVQAPPPGEEDRCDWCGTRGVREFWPLTYHLGVIVASGDACGDCAQAFRPAEVPR